MSEVKDEAIIVVDNEYITLRYLPDKKIIHHTIHKGVEGKPLRDALLKGTEMLKKNGASKWLSDDRNFTGGISQEDVEWGIENWNIPTIEAGWKYWALVVPTEVHAAGSMIPTMNHWYELGLRMMTFDNLEDAFEWLDSMGDE